MGMSLLFKMDLASWCIILLCFGEVWSGFIPIYSDSSQIGTANRAFSFPDRGGGRSECSFPVSLIGPVNLLKSPHEGYLLIGAANTLYMLNASSMVCVANYTWTTDSSSMCTESDFCQNYIRLYETFPSDSSRLLVCGTQSAVRPQCRTVGLGNGRFTSDTPAFNASYGLISSFPEFTSFGEFRRTDSSDRTYFSAGFYEFDIFTTDVGRLFNITFHDVSFNTNTNDLSVTERFSVKLDSLWLNYPVTFVDYYRADYGSDFQFYFVFLRESLSGDRTATIYSRVVRICRNDPGINGQFSTFMKAGIFCEREAPQLRDFYGILDFQYNEIISTVFNNEGRYAQDIEWRKLMYGAFRGPRIGPRGTALCVYAADNSGPLGTNRGIFEVFREDLVATDGTETENRHVRCDPSGRDNTESNYVKSVQSVEQLGEDPILILDGVLVTQMAVDTVCVSINGSVSSCQNQDILFLGTDTGKVLKVVFVVVGVNQFTPVISEEIALDDDSTVNDMKIDSGVLFVSTDTRIYHIPLERCSRYQGCSACIASRDPYCAWNNMTNLCENALSHFSAVNGSTGSVSPQIWQDVHTGNLQQCNTVPTCEVTALAVDHQTIICIAACNNTASINILTTLPSPGGSECDLRSLIPGSVERCVRFTSTSARGMRSYNCMVGAFSKSVQTLPGPPVPFESGVYASCGQTSCEICVQMIELTDVFSNYGFKVHYSSGTDSSSMTSALTSLSVGSECAVISSLLPSTTLNYFIELENSISSLNSSMRTIKLLESFAGPVQNIMASEVTNVSANLMWMPPAVTNGNILGYSIYVNNFTELSCVSQSVATQYTVSDLLPFTPYTIRIHGCNMAGESNMSAEYNIETLCGTPEAVTSATVTDITFEGMIFRWGHPENYNGDATNRQYQVNIAIYGVEGVSSIVTTVNQNQYNLAGILPRTLCCAEIWAIATCGLSGYPVRICERTQEGVPDVVANLMIPDSLLGITSMVVTWEPPLNFNTTPGIAYDISVSNQRMYTVVDATFLEISNLESCTMYTVEISAYNSGSSPGPSSTTSMVVTTKPPLPPPPRQVRLSFNVPSGTPTMLNIIWSSPSDDGCNYNIDNYIIDWSCNGYSNRSSVPSSRMELSVDISDANLGLGWCIAQIRSCSNDRCSDFSDQGSISLPLLPPTQPTCFVQVESITNATFSFAVTQPFITNNTYVNWTLNGSGHFEDRSYTYSSSSSNIITMRVNSNTEYNFMLSICNTYGCSSPCSVDFTTVDVPLPPEGVNVSEVTNTTATVSWAMSNSTAAMSYTISITSSCPTGNMLIPDISATTYSLTMLCPHTNYVIAVQTRDTRANKKSPFSVIYEFTTSPGIPSEPRYVNGIVNIDRKQLIVTWIIPAMLNADIRKYQVLWSFSARSCTSADNQSRFMRGETDNSTTFELVFNIEDESFSLLSICVRAMTVDGYGLWGMYFDLEGNVGGLTSNNGDDCNTLTTVACIAALTVASSLIMSIVLSISVVQKGWFCSKNKEEEKFPKK